MSRFITIEKLNKFYMDLKEKIKNNYYSKTEIDDLMSNVEIDTSTLLDKATYDSEQAIMNGKIDVKVDKITGYGLSKNDFTDTYKDNLIDSNNKKHTHTNKDVLDGITSDLITDWNNAVTHIPDTIKHITSDERTLWNTVSNKAENSHTHDDMYYTEIEIDDKLKNYTTGDELEKIEKQVLENNHISIETDKALTSLTGVKDGFVDNLVIGGKTFQNLNVKRKGIISKTFTNTTGESDRFSNFHLFLDDIQLKPNTVYTYVVDATIWDNDIKLIFGETFLTEPSKFAQKIVLDKKIGRQIFTNRTKTDFSNAVLSDRSFVSAEVGISGSISFTYMILEGDYTNKEIPPYFEGIKSVGESEITDGKYPIKVKSVGKNLFNISEEPLPTTITKNGTEYYTSTDGKQVLGYAILKPNTTYTMCASIKSSNQLTSINDNNKFFRVDTKKNGVTIGGVKGTITTTYKTFNFTFTTTDYPIINIAIRNNYSSIDANLSSNTLYVKDIMLLEGEMYSTEHTPPQEDKTIIQLSEPLRSLPNGVRDTIDYEKGIITRNVGKVILNGSESWNTEANQYSDLTMLFYLINFSGKDSINISDRFIGKKTTNVYEISDDEGVSMSNMGTLRIRILKSRLSTQNMEGFKVWLQANPITLYYQLATPTIESIDNKSTLQTFENGYMQLENSITPIVDLDYSVSIPSVLSRHNKEIDELIDGVNNLTESVGNNAQAIANNTVQLNDMVGKSQIVNNFATTEEGYIADARALKTLYDMCDIKKGTITWANGVESFIDKDTSNGNIYYYKVGKIAIINVGIKIIAQIPQRQTVFTLNDFSSPIGICAVPAQFDSGENNYVSLVGDGSFVLNNSTMSNGYIRAFIVTVTN